MIKLPEIKELGLRTKEQFFSKKVQVRLYYNLYLRVTYYVFFYIYIIWQVEEPECDKCAKISLNVDNSHTLIEYSLYGHHVSIPDF